MLSTRRLQGMTLVELLVALTLAAIVFGAATSSSLRQQRSHVNIIASTDADAQIRAATLVLAGQLDLLDPVAGDLVQGEAQDTAMQVRAPVAQSLACSREVGAATLLPDVVGSVGVGGAVSTPRTGDTLWWLADTAWHAERIVGVNGVNSACANGLGSGQTIQLIVATADTIDAGSPLRVTRQTRYSIYRASDGTYQLGNREWNDSTHRFAAPQPVAGPLLPRSGARRTGFRYFDAAGAELTTAGGPIDVRSIARIRISAQSVVAVHSAPGDSVRVDSVDVALHHAVGH
jgi:prepilin-type N-terminal cleavage/methylation domain-containing protein